MILQLKPSFKSQKGRELDPAKVSPAEKEQFDKVDADILAVEKEMELDGARISWQR